MNRFALATALLLLASCSFPGGEDRLSQHGLRVAVLPDQSEEQLRLRHQPLVDYLRASTGLEMELHVPESYESMLDRFHEREFDLAWFGGTTFVMTERRSGAVPLVARDVDDKFTTDFLVRGSAGERTIEEFAGKTLAFGPPLSTSGHIMPRFHLDRQGIRPEELFAEIRHSAGHDQTAAWVRDGEVDVGASNSLIVEKMQRDGRLAEGEVRLLRRTPPYRNYVWAVHPDLEDDFRTRLMEAFLALDRTLVEHAAILDLQGAKGFMPVSAADYDDLRRAVDLALAVPGESR